MRFPEPSASGRAAARGALLLAALVLWLPTAAQAQAPQNSNNALEYLNIDDVSLFRHSFSGVDRYVGLSGILSITSTVTLRFKLDDPTATCEVKQSSLDLTNTDANLASATTVLASSSCSSSAENVLDVSLPVGNNDLAVLVTAQDGVTQKHGVALSRPSAPSAVLLEGQATGWIIDFGSTVGSGGGDVHIRTWGDATPGVDYELFRQTGTSPPTYVKLEAPDYATPVPSDGRVTIFLTAVDNQFEENREHVQIALYPATSGFPERPVEVAILDNDVAVTFGAATYTAAEGGTVAVTVNLSRDLGWDFEIQLTATGQNGATPADFEIPANVAITAGQTSATFTVTIVDDAIAESGESVALSFTGAANNGVQIQAGNIFTATVSIEGDNDTGEVVVSETELAIAEGESEVYTVSLGSQPTGAVTVTVVGHSGTDLTVSPTELIFTGSSWGPQTVTVTANPDLVQTSYVATLVHMVAGADYGANNVMAESVTVRVMNFTGGVAVSPTELAIDEGGSEVYTVSLESQPTGAVTVTVAGHSGTDLTVSPTELTFTGSSWGSQTITVTANPDLVQTDYVATLTHMVAGANYGANNVMAESVTVRVMNFTGGVAVSPTELAVAEGESGVYTVSLESQPTGAVTVTVAGHSGTDLTVSSTELIFTGSSWGSQTVTVTANPDLVPTSYVATLTHMVAGADYGANNVMAESVTVRVINFIGGVGVSPTELAVAEGESEVYTVSLESQPTGAVTVTVAGHSGTDLTVSPAELIFTNSSWGSQTITVTANPDLVQTDYVETLTHMVAGADYGANNAMAESVTVRVMNFTGGVAVSPLELAIAEGESEVYTVSLGSQPTGAVTVTVAGHSGTDLTVSPTELIFTRSSWGAQTVTVTANPDLVPTDYVATLMHMVAGANYGANNAMAESVTVRVMNFTGRVAVSPTELAIAEGESEVYTVSLGSQPTGAVTVTVAGHSGTDLTVSPTELIFTRSSWGAQTITVTANPDLVPTDYLATLTHMVAGANYGANNVMAESVTVRVMNFTGGVAVSPTELAVAEGESEVYTVSLESQPTGAVTVTVAGHSGTDLTVSPTELVFTDSSWGSQTVTVTANPDLVQTSYVATLMHMVAGANYSANNVMAESVTVRVMNFTGGVGVSLTELAIAEGESEVYTVSLRSQPTGAVTVTVAGHSGTDLTASPAELIFTNSSWSPQTVTVTANPDLVPTDYVETLTHTVGGAGYGTNNVMAESVTVRVMNFTGGVGVSLTELAIAEGESEVYTVSLRSQPTGAVTVTVAGHSGTDLTVSPAELIFTNSSWGSQTITVTANPDLVPTDYVETLTHMVGGANYGANNAMAESVTVRVMNFTGGVAVSETRLEIAEGESEVYTVSLRSQPTGAVTVTVAGHSLTDLTVSPAELIFRSSSWGSQTITVTANPDLELTDYVATLTHMVGGANYGANNVMAESVTVTVMDDQVVRLPIPEDGRVEVPRDSEMLADTMVKLPLPVPANHLLVFKEVAQEGDTDLPPGFMTVEGAVIVDITLVDAGTMIEVPLQSGATVCLPADRTGLRVYHYDADEASPMWMVLPIEDLEEDSACGVTESFSWFALGTAPSDAVEPWLARFGRTVAAHVVEAVSSRLATSTPQQEVTLGGVAPQSALLSGALQTLSDGTAPDARALLSGSSFVLPLSGTGGAPWTVWGRGAYTEFDGREGDTRLDGEVLTSTIGLDWARDRWLAGVAVSHSEGDGDIRAESSSEEIDVSLTGAHPYLRYETEQGISIWGLLGWGEGDLERERDGVSSEVDLEMRMGALGARGRIASYKGFDLSLKSDALAVRLETDAEEDAPELNADASRVRVLLEGAGHYPLKSGGSVVPILETGLRWDEGDAETGLGMELGARMRYSGVGSRLTAELMARALVMHEESAYDEWGVGGSVRLHADELGRGPSLKLESGYGAAESTTGQLWSESGLESFAGQDTSSPSRRFEMELGYGLNTAGGLGVWTPYVGLERLRTESVWRLGGRLELGEALSLQLQGLLRSPEQAVSEHELSMHVSGRW